jgi:hypothetical protein
MTPVPTILQSPFPRYMPLTPRRFCVEIVE